MINATTQALTQIIFDRRESSSCPDLFPNTSLVVKICRDPMIRPTHYDGVLIWVMAYYQNYQSNRGTNFDAQRFLRTRLGLGNNVTAIIRLLGGSKIKNYLIEIEEDFTKLFGCKSKPCDKDYLARKQFFHGSVTNASSAKYPTLNFTSISDMPGNRFFFKNKIPEIFAFLRIHFGQVGEIFGGDPEKLLGFHRGSRV